MTLVTIDFFIETSIELNQDRIFCYDNTPFRFICEEQDEKKRSTFKKAVNYAKSLAFGTNVDIGTAEMAANCWDHSQSEAKRMVQVRKPISHVKNERNVDNSQQLN